MALLAWDEGWHNILGGLRPALVRYLFIRMFAAVGLAWNIKIPGPEKIARRLREPSLDVADLEPG